MLYETVHLILPYSSQQHLKKMYTDETMQKVSYSRVSDESDPNRFIIDLTFLVKWESVQTRHNIFFVVMTMNDCITIFYIIYYAIVVYIKTTVQLVENWIQK